MATIDTIKDYVFEWLMGYDGWGATPARNLSIYPEKFHYDNHINGPTDPAPKGSKDEWYNAILGPDNPGIAWSFVSVGIVAGFVSILVKAYQDKTTREQASLHYAMQQLGLLYGGNLLARLAKTRFTDKPENLNDLLKQLPEGKRLELINRIHGVNIVGVPPRIGFHQDVAFYEAYHSRLPRPFKQKAYIAKYGVPSADYLLLSKADVEAKLRAHYNAIKSALNPSNVKGRDPAVPAKFDWQGHAKPERESKTHAYSQFVQAYHTLQRIAQSRREKTDLDTAKLEVAALIKDLDPAKQLALTPLIETYQFYLQFLKAYHGGGILGSMRRRAFLRSNGLDELPVELQSLANDAAVMKPAIEAAFRAANPAADNATVRAAVKAAIKEANSPANIAANKAAVEGLIKDKFKEIRAVVMEEHRVSPEDPICAARMRMVKLFNQSFRYKKNGKGDLQQAEISDVTFTLDDSFNAKMEFIEKKPGSVPDKLQPSSRNRFFAEDLTNPYASIHDDPLSKKKRQETQSDYFTKKYGKWSAGKQNAFTTVVEAGGALRSALFQNALWYWVGWFALWAITGTVVVTAGLSMGLLFGLPLLIPAIILTVQAIKGIVKLYQKRNKLGYIALSDEDDEKFDFDYAAFNRLMVADAYVSQIKQDYKLQQTNLDTYLRVPGRVEAVKLTSKLTLGVDGEKEQLYGGFSSLTDFLNDARNKVTAFAPKAFDEDAAIPVVKNLLKTTYVGFFNLRKFFAFGSAFIGAYIMTFFSSVPLFDLLAGLGYVMNMTNPAFIGMMAGVVITGFVIGIYCGVQKAREVHEEILDEKALAEKKQGIIEKLKLENTRRETLIGALERQAAMIEQLQASIQDPELKKLLKPVYPNTLSLKQTSEFMRELNPEAVQPTGWRRVGRALLNGYELALKFVFGAGTGSLVVRTLFQVGMIATAIISPPAFLALGMTFALVWGSWKVIELLHKRHLERQQTYLKEAESRLHLISKESALYENTLTNQEKYIEQLKGQKTYEEAEIAAHRMHPAAIPLVTMGQRAKAAFLPEFSTTETADSNQNVSVKYKTAAVGMAR